MSSQLQWRTEPHRARFSATVHGHEKFDAQTFDVQTFDAQTQNGRDGLGTSSASIPSSSQRTTLASHRDLRRDDVVVYCVHDSRVLCASVIASVSRFRYAHCKRRASSSVDPKRLNSLPNFGSGLRTGEFSPANCPEFETPDEPREEKRVGVPTGTWRPTLLIGE